MSANARFNWTFWCKAVKHGGNNLTAFVKISATPLWTDRLTGFRLLTAFLVVVANEVRDLGYWLSPAKIQTPRNEKAQPVGRPET
jgi:hypothetical protein